MKVIEIVRDHLKQGGFDGLVQTDAECGCLLGDLAPCGDDFSKCQPGYRGAYTAGHIGEWSIFTTKEAALESIAEASKQWPNHSTKRTQTGPLTTRWSTTAKPVCGPLE